MQKSAKSACRLCFISLCIAAIFDETLSQPAPGFENLKEGAALNEKQENAMPDISGNF